MHELLCPKCGNISYTNTDPECTVAHMCPRCFTLMDFVVDDKPESDAPWFLGRYPGNYEPLTADEQIDLWERLQKAHQEATTDPLIPLAPENPE